MTLLWTCLVVLALALGIRAWAGSRRRMSDVAAPEDPLPVSDRVGEAVLDSIPLGVVVGDTAGVPVFRNAAADALVDSWEDGVVGRLVAERLVAAAGGRGSSGQVRMPGSPPRLIEVTAVALAAPGASAVVVFDDVTERHRQEAVRRDFVANVSHELKTPIGALCLLAETLADEREPEVVARLTSHIGTESQRAAAIVESLLDLSRIEEAPVEATPRGLGSKRGRKIDFVGLDGDGEGAPRRATGIKDSTGFAAAAWWRARPCSSAATRASANRPCCCRRPPHWLAALTTSSMFPVKRPSTRLNSARNASA